MAVVRLRRIAPIADATVTVAVQALCRVDPILVPHSLPAPVVDAMPPKINTSNTSFVSPSAADSTEQKH